MEINGIDNIKSTLKIVKAINDFISKKKKELPYNINVIDELHANENAHSRILCKLLQYKDSSDKYRILESLLSYISLLEGKEKFSEVFIKSPLITQEKERIDLWVRDMESRYAIILENKIKGAVDQDAQLARYIDNTIKQGFLEEKIFVIYLPSDGHEPAPYSWVHEGKDYKKNFQYRYVNLSYKEHVLPWLKEIVLPNCIIKEELLISAIKQYVDHLEGLFFMRPSQKKMIMNKELLNEMGLRADLGFAEQYNDFEKVLNQLGEVRKILTDYRQNEVLLLMNKFIQYSKEILGEEWEFSKDNISLGNGWLYLYNKNWKTKSYVHLEWSSIFYKSLYTDKHYRFVLHLEGGWNKKSDFVERLFKTCPILHQSGLTTFYVRDFKCNTPIGRMTDNELQSYLEAVYKSEDIQTIIFAINEANKDL